MALLSRLKEKISRITVKKSRVKNNVKHSKSKVKPQAEKNECFGTHETYVGTSKFFPPESSRQPVRTMPQELPLNYGIDKIVLQVRDPWWLHSYWEVTSGTWERLQVELGGAFYQAKKILRVYDVTNIIFNGSNANRSFNISINNDATSWYIDTAGPGRSWCVDLGLLLADGRFITIVRSNVAFTPLEGPSWITDEEWMIPDDLFARLYGLGFGFGKSSPGKGWQEKMRRELFSGILSSPGLASPVKQQPKEKTFWFVVNTELIVYGATEPDAKVVVQGRPVSLRPDGTFSMRFALPDGKQVIPCEATSADYKEKRSITPIVSKETK